MVPAVLVQGNEYGCGNSRNWNFTTAMTATFSVPQDRLLHDMRGSPCPLPVLPPRCYRQLTGECGSFAEDLRTWTAVFDEVIRDEVSPDDTALLTLSICAPFGEYELELETDSYSSPTSDMKARTSWEILNGSDEVMVETWLAEMLPPEQLVWSSIFAWRVRS